MFTNEQDIIQKFKKPIKKAVFKTGMALAKSDNMKRRITYKELTLAFGIVVAMLVAFTLWAKNPAEQEFTRTSIMPKPIIPIPAKNIIQTVLEVIH